MKLIGFNFTKLNIDKKSENRKDLKINTNINISKITDVNSDFFNSNEKILGIEFNYVIEYSPNIAKLSFEGNILISTDEKEAKNILDEWKKKKLTDRFRDIVFNIIFRKCNIKALYFEDEMNLPLHIPMPLLKNQEEEKKEK